MMSELETLKEHALALKLHGLLNHWDELTSEQIPWLTHVLTWELSERKQRSLERRLYSAKLGRFKPLTEFDWQWPTKIDQQAIHRLMQLDFITDASNIIFIGGNGVGKSTIAQGCVCVAHSPYKVPRAARLPARLASGTRREIQIE